MLSCYSTCCAAAALLHPINIVKVGGMVQRWEALREGKQDGTLLSTPFDILAKEQGLQSTCPRDGDDRPISGQCRSS